MNRPKTSRKKFFIVKDAPIKIEELHSYEDKITLVFKTNRALTMESDELGCVLPPLPKGFSAAVADRDNIKTKPKPSP